MSGRPASTLLCSLRTRSWKIEVVVIPAPSSDRSRPSAGRCVAAAEEAEHHRRPERATGAAVSHAERRAHDVPSGVEARDRVPVDVDDPAIRIDLRATLGAEGTALDLEGVVRPLAERTERRVAAALAVRIAPPAVE